MNYLLTGPEEYLKRQFVDRLKKSALSKNGLGTLDCETYYAGESEPSLILNSLNTLPFFSRKRLIVVKNIDKFSANEKKLILCYLGSPRDFSIFVLETSLNERGNKFLEEIARLAKSVRCLRMKDKDIDLWIKKEFASLGKSISPETAGVMRGLAGMDLFFLKNEVEKISLYIGNEKEVKTGHIEAALGKSAQAGAFELIDLILEKRADRLLESLDSLLIKEKPHEILNLLAWQFRNFIKLKEYRKRLSAEDAARILNTNAWLGRRILEKSGRFTLKELKENCGIILKADYSIKRGKMDQRHVLERVLVGLAR